MSAIIPGIAGILLIFLPDEIAVFIVRSADMYPRLLMQILGALYFGFAMLNWMARESAIGGIYNRPITVANLTHFAIGALALIKCAMADHQLPLLFWIITICYLSFAAGFGILLFKHPGEPAGREKKD